MASPSTYPAREPAGAPAIKPAPMGADGRPPDSPSEPESRTLAAGPPAPIYTLPLAAVSVEHLGIGEMLDLCEALEVDMDGMAALMRSRGIQRARVLVGFAWILARRDDPSISWLDAQRWRITVDTGAADFPPGSGEPPTPEPIG